MNESDEKSDLFLFYRDYALSKKLATTFQIPKKAQHMLIQMQNYVDKGLFNIDTDKLKFYKQHLGSDHRNVVINCYDFDNFNFVKKMLIYIHQIYKIYLDQWLIYELVICQKI